MAKIHTIYSREVTPNLLDGLDLIKNDILSQFKSVMFANTIEPLDTRIEYNASDRSWYMRSKLKYTNSIQSFYKRIDISIEDPDWRRAVSRNDYIIVATMNLTAY